MSLLRYAGAHDMSKCCDTCNGAVSAWSICSPATPREHLLTGDTAKTASSSPQRQLTSCDGKRPAAEPPLDEHQSCLYSIKVLTADGVTASSPQTSMMSLNPQMVLGLLVGSSLLSNGVLAGLGDAKHSTKLDHSNFNTQIEVPEICMLNLHSRLPPVSKSASLITMPLSHHQSYFAGMLVAFFAPWCGYCKYLIDPWDQVNDNPSFSCTGAASKTFESNSKC
ncbi:uncharacterized protein VP01_1091g1 [Puccinia sorghi]|uniref:Thioredoxin domain-containing protein n=1 Tax=Puccinia sorghi TaxID=27349 RepID=A0A0L6VT29_9BASI|nr:uncharacterized protein VP01_1091g1 [Puccinia sorghi]